MRNFLILAVAWAVVLSGCSKTRSLEGKWAFDRPYTEEHLSQELAKPSASPSGMESMIPAMTAMAMPMLIAQLDGAVLTINAKEMIFMTKDGTGKANDYEVLERPDDHTWRVKGADGKIETYTREGDQLALTITGGLQMKVYFKRADR